MNEIKGILSAENKKFAIIVAQFNTSITEKLLLGAKDCILKHSGSEKNIDVVWVPGALELAPVARRLESISVYHAIICLGAVIRGETSHYDFVAGNTASGIATIGQNSTLPILFGVLTVDTIDQAFNRSGIKQGNAGYNAALAAIDMISVYQQIDSL